jgi:hypothetical protein
MSDSSRNSEFDATRYVGAPDGRSPRTHSASGMFCPACDARIGIANACECGASVFNGWYSDAERATYSVKREHSGSEDGALWYVVDATGSRVSGDGHMHRESAQHELDDAAKLAGLSTAARDAVLYMRSSCPAPGDYAAAVIVPSPDGPRVGEYRQRACADRNVIVLDTHMRDLRAGLALDYSTVPGAYVVDVCGDTFPAVDALAAIEDVADGMREVAAGEYSADAREYLDTARAKLAAMVAALPMGWRADLDASVLDAAGFLRVTGRVVERTDDIGHTYGHGAVVLSQSDADAAADWAREWVADCDWRDSDTLAAQLRDMSASTVLTLAAVHYDGGLTALVSDALNALDALAKMDDSGMQDDAPESNVSDMLAAAQWPGSDEVDAGDDGTMTRPQALTVENLRGELESACRCMVDMDTLPRADGSVLVILTADSGGAPDAVTAVWSRDGVTSRGVYSTDDYVAALIELKPHAAVQRESSALYTVAPGGSYVRGVAPLAPLTACERIRIARTAAKLDMAPATPGAFGAGVDSAMARHAVDAADTWQSSGELSDDVRTASDVLADLPGSYVAAFLARVARVAPYNDPSAGGYVDGRDILDKLAGDSSR